MNIAVCDDQKECNAKLRKMLERYFEQKQIENYDITEYESGRALIEDFAFGLFGLIFLDIEMPKLGGFETAEYIAKLDKNVSIVFVTYMVDQVYSSFRYKPKDYLCKPVSQEKIDELVDRLLDDINRNKEDDFYSVKLKHGGNTQLYLPEILYFESDNKYVVATTSTSAQTFSGSMDGVIGDLGHKGFTRISRTVIVNDMHVFQVFAELIVLKGGINFTIGKTFRDKTSKTLKGKWM